MKGLDWRDRNAYWHRLARRRSYYFMKGVAEHFSPDQLLHGRNIPVHNGGVIPLPNSIFIVVKRKRQLTLFECGFVHRPRLQ